MACTLVFRGRLVNDFFSLSLWTILSCEFLASSDVVWRTIHNAYLSFDFQIPGLKEIAAADRDRPVIESVIEYCKREEQRQWMNQVRSFHYARPYFSLIVRLKRAIQIPGSLMVFFG